ncbi:hypothetical protein [Rhizobium sp. CF080]|uniref:hypothetical protein n=1 Tax=Rhizobium sp. (strain CF080) TaxID=1144310 RepID=UPI0012DFB2EC|nr:hypothetical protein [Rhizobium sp. CF080]
MSVSSTFVFIECPNGIRTLLKTCDRRLFSADAGKPVLPFSGSDPIAFTQYDGLHFRVTIHSHGPLNMVSVFSKARICSIAQLPTTDCNVFFRSLASIRSSPCRR